MCVNLWAGRIKLQTGLIITLYYAHEGFYICKTSPEPGKDFYFICVIKM